MFRLCLLACVFVGAAFATTPSGDLEYRWGLFKETYKKEYHPKEEPQRRLIWEENVKIIREHNLMADMGIKTYRLGLNKYADLSSKEFREQVLGFNRLGAQPGAPNCSRTYMPPKPTDLPSSVDWREKGYVTPVKDQKQCGSCWAFSATGSLEGQHFKKTGKLVSLSEQNLVDCAQKQGNNGCGGGFMQAAFKYIAINGIDTEASYPYTAKDGKCNFNKANVGATATGCMDIALESEEDLKSAVARVGPISVAIDAGHSSFQLYKSGMYSELFCSQDRLDHGVLAVGYGSMDGMDYWLVKNSWGLSWGEKGYINMRRGEYNQCGISTSASFPTV